MVKNNEDLPRLPAEDIVDRSTEIPDVAHDDERHAPGDDGGHSPSDTPAGGDLDPHMTD